MDRLAPPVRRDHWGFSVVIAAFLVVHLGVGAAMLLGNPQRFTAPAYEPVLALLPVRVWGALFLTLGVGMLAGVYLPRRWYLLRWAAIVGVPAFAAWAAAFGIAWWTNPAVSPHGVLLFTALAMISLGAAAEPAVNPATQRRG